MYDLHISSGETSKSSVIFSFLHAQVQNTVSSTIHNHDEYEIYLFLSGDIRMVFENDSRIMKRGDLVLILPPALSPARLRRPRSQPPSDTSMIIYRKVFFWRILRNRYI